MMAVSGFVSAVMLSKSSTDIEEEITIAACQALQATKERCGKLNACETVAKIVSKYSEDEDVSAQ